MYKVQISRPLLHSAVGCLLSLACCADAISQTPPAATIPANEVDAEHKEDQSANEKAFQELLNNCVLVGQFTVDGQSSGPAKEERYEIRNVSKLDDSDLWGMNARIAYGDHDVTVPIAVPVKFAGKTPMISLDDFFVPGMGTFSARVLFHGDRYAGTWQHGDKGGHMFGYIKRLEETDIKEKNSKE